MANWKKVDADQLDADMTTVANAIRNRAGTTEQMEFPGGFVSAVESVPDYLADRCNGTLIEYESEKVTKMGTHSLAYSSTLKKVSLPYCTAFGWESMQDNTALCDVYVPRLRFPGYGAFARCTALSKLDLPLTEYLDSNVFLDTSLKTLILRWSKTCQLGNTNSFGNTPIANGTGYIYVPRSLVDTYKSATNWSNYANQIRAIEDYPDITGG